MLISITVIALKINFEKHYLPEVGMCHYKEAIFVGEDVYKHLQFFLYLCSSVKMLIFFPDCFLFFFFFWKMLFFF